MKTQEPQHESRTSTLEFVDRFRRRLTDRGYRKSTVDQYVPIYRKLGTYLFDNRIPLNMLGEKHVEAFLDEATTDARLRDGGKKKRRFWRSPLLLLLEQLRSDGISPRAKPNAVLVGPAVTEYLDFVKRHRGFCDRTVNRRRLHITRLLAALDVQTEEGLQHITIDQIDRYLVGVAKRLARESIGSVCASIRDFFRYLYIQRLTPANLANQITTPHIYPLAAMPRSVKWSEIERTLGVMDRRTALGCRDYAILMLIAYCGLRACDVAALRLDDLDWRRDAIRARRPKDGSTDEVPLVGPVGEALLAYLRVRPRSPHREVVLTAKAPISPVTGPRISAIAKKYLQRAEVQSPKLGSHTLRHSFAVELLRRGQSLRTIGDALGHHHPQSTFLYAKAALDDLREAALGIEEVRP